MIDFVVGLIVGALLMALFLAKRLRVLSVMTVTLADYTALTLLATRLRDPERRELLNKIDEAGELGADVVVPVIRRHLVHQAAGLSLHGAQGSLITAVVERRQRLAGVSPGAPSFISGED
jgi:hypothetical protein